MKTSKLIKIILLILVITAVLSCLQLCLQVHDVQINRRSLARLFLADGTEYAGTIPVELELIYHYYPVHIGNSVNSLEIKAVATEKEVEIFNGVIVYNFLYRKWQWVAHDGEGPEERQINHQAVFTNFSKQNRGDNASFLFCIDDISKITGNETPGQKGLLLAMTEEAADAPADILQSLMGDTVSGAADFIRKYGIFGEGAGTEQNQKQ